MDMLVFCVTTEVFISDIQKIHIRCFYVDSKYLLDQTITSLRQTILYDKTKMTEKDTRLIQTYLTKKMFKLFSSMVFDTDGKK
jgi:hypothetical protein